MKMISTVPSVPGKVILLGEHFVVKGIPALAMAINLRARARASLDKSVGEDCIRIKTMGLGIDLLCGEAQPTPGPAAYAAIARKTGIRGGVSIDIESSIPPGAGLGSSAATSSSVAAASLLLVEGRPPGLDRVLEAAMVGERIFHGKPSGLDVVVGLVGGIVVFENINSYEKIRAPSSIYKEAVFIIANTRVPRRTSEAVARVLQRYERRKRIMASIYSSARVLVEEALEQLTRGKIDALGELMDIAHGLLSAIGVSFPEAESIIYEARKKDALGAKITGAGLGGGVLILARRKDFQELVEVLKTNPLVSKMVIVSVEDKGIVYERPPTVDEGG